MFGMQILDVAIGLIFIFLLLSLVVTAANELIASWLKRRSTTLWRGVVQLLGEEKMAAEVYSHPLIAGLNEKPWFKEYREKLPFKKRPSYIPSRTFALALLDRLAPVSPPNKPKESDDLPRALAARLKAHPDDHLAKSMIVLLEDVNGNIEEFKKNVEIWFNNSMERVTGWYKRRTQWILLLLAVVVTVWMNADTIAIANTLWRDPAMRSALVAEAQQFAEQQRKEMETAPTEPRTGPPAPPDRLPYESAEAEDQTASEKFERSVARLEDLAIPLGWRDGARGDDQREELPRNWAQWRSALDRHFLGWLLTALAISLGAPFWFDMLNKVIAIRAAGKAPEEKPKPPKEVPAPVEPGGEPAKS